ncbi:MAG: hypothetical protein M5U26_22085 [Planctomycetota bacterium]|nr:hypothetical protein [Planctomycetota bacterium]
MGILGPLALGLLIGLGFYAGYFFWVYWYVKLRLKRMAEGKYSERPVALFVFGLLGFIVAAVSVGMLLAGMIYVAASLGMGSLAWIGLSLVGLGVGGAGCIGWVVVFFQRLASKSERLRYERKHPAPKLHLFMQDLYAAAFCFGIYMAFQSGFGDAFGNEFGGDPLPLAGMAAWVILAMSCGLYFALDACRRSLRLQRPLPRLAFVFGTILFTTLTSLIPAWLGWRAWRYAMFKADWALGQDLLAQREAARAEAEPAAAGS